MKSFFFIIIFFYARQQEGYKKLWKILYHKWRGTQFYSEEEQSLNLDKVGPLKTKFTTARDCLQPHNFNYEPKSRPTTNTPGPP